MVHETFQVMQIAITYGSLTLQNLADYYEELGLGTLSPLSDKASSVFTYKADLLASEDQGWLEALQSICLRLREYLITNRFDERWVTASCFFSTVKA